jgi:putative ABC transport system permease protein
MIFLNKSLQITVNLSAINSDFQYYSFVAGILPAVYVANFETLKVLKGNFGRSKTESGCVTEC